MKTRILPVIVTTGPALEQALTTRPQVIYIDRVFLDEFFARYYEAVENAGYIPTPKAGRNGLYYWNKHSLHDPEELEIHDPLGIL